MRHPQVLVYETDNRLARALQPLCAERRWVLREPRRTEACLELLRERPGVLVLRLGKQLERELRLLRDVSWRCPAARSIVVGDVENDALAGLAWDLGAHYVLFPPQPRELVRDLVDHMLTTSGKPKADHEPVP